VIQNNTLEGEVESGVYIAGPFKGQIIGNTMRNNIQAGITIVSNVKDVLIKNNQIYNNNTNNVYHQGIRLLGDSGLAIRHVQITNNAIYNEAEDGILIQTNGGIVDGVSINSNSLFNNGMYGVFIEEKAAANTITNITMTDNCFANNAVGPFDDSRGTNALSQPDISATCSK
jgi:hypothetical protein